MTNACEWNAPAIEVSHLSKTFRIGIRRKRVQALRDVSFQVPSGSVFGFLGPNGAGKTTTIKILVGLIRQTQGKATVLSAPPRNPNARKNLGFLPETPYVYPYLTPLEFVRLCGCLSGIPQGRVTEKAQQALELVGVSYAADRPVAKLSKGMLQRTCLASALVHEPQLIILDEPMSGLDPVGRKQVRDIIVQQKKLGRTVFFSSHILSDVESLCDQVVILRNGNVVVQGKLDHLLQHNALYTDIVLAAEHEKLRTIVKQLGIKEALQTITKETELQTENIGDILRVSVKGEKRVHEVLTAALKYKARVIEVTRRRETLEDVFMKQGIVTCPDHSEEQA